MSAFPASPGLNLLLRYLGESYGSSLLRCGPSALAVPSYPAITECSCHGCTCFFSETASYLPQATAFRVILEGVHLMWALPASLITYIWSRYRQGRPVINVARYFLYYRSCQRQRVDSLARNYRFGHRHRKEGGQDASGALEGPPSAAPSTSTEIASYKSLTNIVCPCAGRTFQVYITYPG